jgi:hypothetical protein
LQGSAHGTVKGRKIIATSSQSAHHTKEKKNA